VAAKLLRALVDTDRPLVAEIVPMRTCSLDCAYCVEYDHISRPVPLDVVQGRVDRLAALDTAIVTISGGEPLRHPDLVGIVDHIRRRRMLAALVTAGHLLSSEMIAALNQAGLDHLQIRMAGLAPGEGQLDPGLRRLAEQAEFGVSRSPVFGGGPDGYMRLNRRAPEGSTQRPRSGWSCRAGARYLYVDEFGLVHYCSSQRGAPG
jgi:Radical SAM superfamily